MTTDITKQLLLYLAFCHSASKRPQWASCSASAVVKAVWLANHIRWATWRAVSSGNTPIRACFNASGWASSWCSSQHSRAAYVRTVLPRLFTKANIWHCLHQGLKLPSVKIYSYDLQETERQSNTCHTLLEWARSLLVNWGKRMLSKGRRSYKSQLLSDSKFTPQI